MEPTLYRAWSVGKSPNSRRFGLSAEPRRPGAQRCTHFAPILAKSHQGNGTDWSAQNDESSIAQATPMSGLPHHRTVQRVGTCVQVPHQTFLDMGPMSDRFWTLVTHTLVPGPDRRDMAILLACLESVYRAEYQQLAGEAIAAIAAANNAHVRPNGAVAEPQLEAVGSLGSTPVDQPGGEQQSERQRQWQASRVEEGEGESPLPAVEVVPGQLARSHGIHGVAVDPVFGAGLDEAYRGIKVDEDGGGGMAAELDAEVLRQLLRLAQRAGYQPLTVRDVRLADSLNTDYLSQLFIKGSPRRLDGALVQDYVDPSLPAEARPVLLLQRGYGRELQAGRLLLQKLDYLQTLAVGQAGSLVGGAAAVLAAVLFGTFEEAGPGGAPFFVDALAGQEVSATSDTRSGISTAAGEPTGTSGVAAAGVDAEEAAARSAPGESGSGMERNGAAAGTRLYPGHNGHARDSSFPFSGLGEGERGEAALGPAVKGVMAKDPREMAKGDVLVSGAAAVAAMAAARAGLQALAQGQQQQQPPSRRHDPLSGEERNPLWQQQQQQQQQQQHPGPVVENPQVQVPRPPNAPPPCFQNELGMVLHTRADGRPVVGMVSSNPASTEAEAAWPSRPACTGQHPRGAAARAPTTAGIMAAVAVSASTAAVETAGALTSSSTGADDERGSELEAACDAAAGTKLVTTTDMSSPPVWEPLKPMPAQGNVDCVLCPHPAAERSSVGRVVSAIGGDGDDVGVNACSVDDSSRSSRRRRSSSGSRRRRIRSDGVRKGDDDDDVLLTEGRTRYSVRPSDRSGRVLAPAEIRGEAAAAADGSIRGGAMSAATVSIPAAAAAPADEAVNPKVGDPSSPPPLAPSPWATALSGIYSALSDWGLVPRTDVIPLPAFNAHFPVRERPGRQPLYICKVSLGDALGGADWLQGGLRGLLNGLVREVQLQEPTFREVLVLYRPAHNRMAPALEPPPQRMQGSWRRHRRRGGSWRRRQVQGNDSKQYDESGIEEFGDNNSEGGASAARTRAAVDGSSNHERRPRVIRGLGFGWLRRLWASWRGVREEEPAVRRPPIQIRIYRDIPLPTWKVVLPEKLLQFRPLDLLRVDLFSLAGLVGLAAQARYDSMLVDVITFGSAAVLLVRIILGYQRMSDRFRSVVNELLAEKALASQEGAVEALAMAAAQQQLRQAALAYVLLLHHGKPGAQELQLQQRAATGVTAGAAAAAETVMDPEAAGFPAMATTAQLQELAEWALAHHSGVQVCFNACQALHELHRLGLVVRVTQEESGDDDDGGDDAPCVVVDDAYPEDVALPKSGGGYSSAAPTSQSALEGGNIGITAAASKLGVEGAEGFARSKWQLGGDGDPARQEGHAELHHGCGCGDPSLDCDGWPECCRCANIWWAAVPLRDAVPVVEDHWSGLLWRRVGAILRRRDGL